MTANDVRIHLLALSREGDDLRGGDWADIQDWHAQVLAYVRAALGDGPADDVASRLRCTRGANQVEKEANAVGYITDWLGTQVVGLTQEKIRPEFDGKVPMPATITEDATVEVVLLKDETVENADGDTGPEAE